jgi:cytoskeleton protein RodZ
VSEIDNFESVSSFGNELSEPAASLGQQLRMAREARGLSIDEVVHALKFSARQVEAVEADHMEVLPGSVFQRGLVRSYARFLKLDPEPLLALIEAQAPAQEPEIRAPENMGNAAPKGGLHQIPPLVAMSVLLLIAAGAMIGWHYLGGGVPGAPLTVDSARTAVVEAPKLEPEKVVPPAPVAADASAATVVPPHAEVVAPAAPAPVASPAPAPAASAAAPAPAPTLPPDARRLSFNFQGESWIEVKDASGLVILTGIYHSGTQSVAGRAPFEVVIGNSGVVTMRDDGRTVDLKPYTRAEVARLTLK